jgi:gamma-glutamyl-gamma-aminobutyrate hydrolase PuuD
MPLIGITSCRKLEDYRQSVLHAGGDVRIIEPSEHAGAALEGIDGLLLTGGEDIAPERYGEPRHPAVTDAEAGRDELELAAAGAARARGLPILAICRGIQVLNVACRCRARWRTAVRCRPTSPSPWRTKCGSTGTRCSPA